MDGLPTFDSPSDTSFGTANLPATDSEPQEENPIIDSNTEL